MNYAEHIYLCRADNESVMHIFYHCQFTRQVWQQLQNQGLRLPFCQYFAQKNFRSAILDWQQKTIIHTQVAVAYLRTRKKQRW